MLDTEGLATLLEAYDLGEGTLSAAPVALGRVGAVWRLDATSGVWAVKTNTNPEEEDGAAATAGFQEAAVAAGVPAPGVRRTRDGAVLTFVGRTSLRVLEWVDMAGPDATLDPVAVGGLLAGLHRVPPGPWAGRMPTVVDPWFTDPLGAAGWDDIVEELTRRDAPFAAAFAAHRDELVALEALIEEPRDLRVCHRDLFSDNLRARAGGGLVVFDFDNAGPGDPAQELAMVLVEYAAADAAHPGEADGTRAAALREAYESAGGPGRLTGPGSFSMVIAVFGHISEVASRRWLLATDDDDRADLAAWAAELTDRPLTRAVIAQLLYA